MAFKGLQLADTAFLARASSVVVSPNDFPGLVRWYKADTYALADGDTVGGAGREWIDQSASAVNATQSAAGSRPIFRTNVFGSLPAIDFTVGYPGVWFEMAGLTLAGDFTVISIAKAGASTTLVGSLTQNLWIRLFVAATAIDMYDGVNHPVSDVFTTAFNSVNMSSWRRNGAGNLAFRERNIARGDVAGSVVSNTWTELGGTTGAGGGDAKLGELCIWNTRLSDADVDSLYQNYFRARWGLP